MDWVSPRERARLLNRGFTSPVSQSPIISDARAAAVMAELTAYGVTAAQPTNISFVVPRRNLNRGVQLP